MFPLLAGWFVEVPWAILAIGFCVACAAFVVGRRMLSSRPAPQSPATPRREPVFLHGARVERRAAPRRGGNNVGVLVSDDPPQPKMQGWVLDRSVGGLCLLVSQPLEEGKVVHVQPQAPGRTPPWVALEVRHCRPDASDWVANCQFVKAPEYSTMLLFG
jgi:hypothetical protein